MKTFKSYIQKVPGAGFEGTNALRKDHVSKTPGQVDPIKKEKPTPHLEESQKFTSAATSINKSKLPKGYTTVGKHFGWEKGTVHLDIGGGRNRNPEIAVYRRNICPLVKLFNISTFSFYRNIFLRNNGLE